MKKIHHIFMILIVLCLMGVPSFAEEESSMQMSVGSYNPKGVLISVEAKGLVCEFCAKALEKVLMREERVAGVRVDLTTKEILVSLKEGMNMEDEEIERLVIDAGYNVANISRKDSLKDETNE